MRGRRLVLLAASVVAGLGILAPIAHADGIAFDRKIENGTVDFGDWVSYTLTGTGCAGHAVKAVVVGPSGAAESATSPNPSSCAGTVRVPTEDVVRQKTGWTAGAPVSISLQTVDGGQSLDLRYQRVEVDQGTTPDGDTPATVPSQDTRQGPSDMAVPMSTGDVVHLGKINLTDLYSVSLRVCVTLPKPHVSPSFMELREDTADGPSVIGRVDVADDVNNPNKSNFGWPDCWQLQPWPIINGDKSGNHDLFLAMVATAGPVEVTYVDFNGTGAAKEPERFEPGPSTMTTIFDPTNGISGGWAIGDKCLVDSDGSVHQTHTTEPQNYAPLATFGFVGESGCSMTYNTQVHDVMIRFQYRLQDFEDNGAIYIDGHEIQMRQAGEWMTGGIQGTTLPQALTNAVTNDPTLNEVTGYPAQRIKSNTFPAWSEIEIVQLGAHFVVRINGRTVTDCYADDNAKDCLPDLRDADGNVKPWTFSMATQPNFSYHYGAGYRMDTGPNNPVTDDPSNWGNISFKNVRLYQCGAAVDDPCRTVPGVNG